MRPLGAYIRSYGLVLWSAGGVFLWLVGCCMAAESLSGSWSAQVPERPAAVGSRCVPPEGVWGVTPDMQLDVVGGCGKKLNFY